jgi:Tfp pilus assembly protein PilO
MKDNKIVAVLKRYPIALCCVLVLVVLAVLLFMRSGKNEELSTVEQERHSRMDVIDKNVIAANGLKEDLAAVEAIVQQIDERVFDRDARAVNTNFFYSFEKDLDVVVQSVRQMPDVPQSMTKGGPHQLSLRSAIVYELVVGGNYAGLIGFMDAVYQRDAIMRISDFRISKVTAAGTPEGQLNAAMRVYVLAKKD